MNENNFWEFSQTSLRSLGGIQERREAKEERWEAFFNLGTILSFFFSLFSLFSFSFFLPKATSVHCAVTPLGTPYLPTSPKPLSPPPLLPKSVAVTSVRPSPLFATSISTHFMIQKPSPPPWLLSAFLPNPKTPICFRLSRIHSFLPSLLPYPFILPIPLFTPPYPTSKPHIHLYPISLTVFPIFIFSFFTLLNPFNTHFQLSPLNLFSKSHYSH